MILPIDPRPGVLLLNGTVGVGKTTVAEAIGDRLADAGVPGAVVDIDWLRRCWPAPDGDPFHLELALRNVGALARNFTMAGATHLVLAGVVETRAERTAYAAAIGLPLRVARLRVALPLVRERLTVRHRCDPAGLRWHLHRCAELDQVLDHAGVDDFTVDATSLRVDAAAEAVLLGAGWLTD
jgi:adenylylsulfate kinase-like enzyme